MTYYVIKGFERISIILRKNNEKYEYLDWDPGHDDASWKEYLMSDRFPFVEVTIEWLNKNRRNHNSWTAYLNKLKSEFYAEVLA